MCGDLKKYCSVCCVTVFFISVIALLYWLEVFYVERGDGIVLNYNSLYQTYQIVNIFFLFGHLCAVKEKPDIQHKIKNNRAHSSGGMNLKGCIWWCLYANKSLKQSEVSREKRGSCFSVCLMWIHDGDHSEKYSDYLVFLVWVYDFCVWREGPYDLCYQICRQTCSHSLFVIPGASSYNAPLLYSIHVWCISFCFEILEEV